MAQLTFKFPLRPSYAPEDFIPSPTNRRAMEFLETWPGATPGVALLSGPEASGKTHLVHNWAVRVQARFIDMAALGHEDSAGLWGNAPVAVAEDMHAVADATALFHLLRHAEAHGVSLLLTSRVPAAQLPFTLPDLRSRLVALPTAAIEAPDEELLRAFLFKCFADRQLRVSSDVVDYLAKRMERSFAAARHLADAVEARATQTRREVTIPLVKSLLQG